MKNPRRLLRLLSLALLALACAEEADPLERVRAAHERGRFASTLTPLRRVLDRDPDNIEASFRLGIALLRTDQASLAIWPLRRAYESPEYAVEAGLLLAGAMLESRTAPDALAVIEDVLVRAPGHVGALVLRSRALLATGKLEAGLADTERVLELDPENLAVLIPRITSLIALRRIDEVEAAILRARSAMEATEQAIPPDMRPRLCVVQGLFRFEKGEPDAAVEEFERCLVAFPEDRLVVSEAVGFYDKLGRPERGTEILEQKLAATGAGVFRIALAQRKGSLGDLDSQLRLLREEAELHPSGASWFLVADLYVQREQFDLAVDAFARAIAADPEPPAMLRFAYADTLVQAGRYERARELLPALKSPALADLIRGRILLAEGDARGALDAFEAGNALWPNNPSGRFLAAEAAEQLGDFPRAVAQYRESLRISAGFTTAGLELARLLAMRGDDEGALAAIRRYASARPDDPEVYLVSIASAHRLGRHEVVTEALARLAQLPDQAAVAVREEALLLGADHGPALAVEAVERASLSLVAPENLPALRVYAQQLVALGEAGRALAAVDAAIVARADEAPFHALRGEVLALGAGPSSEAAAAFRRALELDASCVAGLLGLAQLEATAGRADAALALHDRALAAQPDAADAALAAAALLRKLDRPGEAEQRLLALLAHAPRQGEAAHQLALLLEARGPSAAGLAMARRALWLGVPEAEGTLRRIEAGLAGTLQHADEDAAS